MKALWKTYFCTTALAMFASGCQSDTLPSRPEASTHAERDGDDGEADVKIAMAELNPKDRREAEAQKFCAVMSSNLLGSMGAPLKLDVNGQPVFVCCAGCKSKALKNPDETLATVAKLKAENSISKK